MNTAPVSTSRPRLACRVIRTCAAVFDLSRSRHVAGCAECRAHFDSLTEFDITLHRAALDASRQTPAASTGFERRILQAVRESAAGPDRSPGTLRRFKLSHIAGFAAAAAVAAIVFTRGPWRDRSDEPGMIARAGAELLVDTVDSLSSRLTESVIPSAGEMVARNPLQQELGSVYNDMRSALDFLALNFLPTAPASTAPRRSGTG